jgi:hypothetical protein
MKIQAMTQAEQTKAQLEQAKLQTQGQIEQSKLQTGLQIEQFKAEQAQQLEIIRQQAETERAQMKLNADRLLQIELAQLKNENAIENAVEKVISEKLELSKNDAIETTREIVQQFADQLNETIKSQEQNAGIVLAKIKESINMPRKLIRDKNGKTIGVEINGQVRQVIRDNYGKIVGI